MPSALFNPQLLRRLEQFQLVARRLARSSAKGERRSRARGQSVEFADFRNYSQGDDLRYLDWNLYGRLDRLFIKLYEEERELPVTILLDASESMNFGTPTKFDFARQVAAAVGYVALCGFDRVSVQVLPAQTENFPVLGELRTVRGRRSATRFLNSLEALRPGGQFSFNESLRRVALETRQSGVAVVLSDFLDPAGYEEGLKTLVGRGFHVNALQVLAHEEVEPETFGELRVVDSESGATQEVTFGRYRLKAYQKSVRLFCGRLKEFCRARGVSYFRTTSDADLEALLLKQLREADIWR